MYRLLHFISEENILKEYKDALDLEQSYKKYAHGLEVIRCGFDHTSYISNSSIIGLHLPFYSDWLSFWKGNKTILKREFGQEEVWEKFYGDSDPSVLIRYFQKEMDYAQEIGVKYVVFHVSNVSIAETIYRKYDYSDREVIYASIDLINRLFEGKKYSFEFLVENLPWPGLQFTDASLAMELLNGISYNKKGFLLDIGHMMQTNLQIKSSEEGIDYIYNWFKENRDLIPYIRAIHLHQSISGERIKEMERNPIALKEDFYEKFAQVYKYIFTVDRHEVCEGRNTMDLVQFLNPEYLVYEFRSISRKDREEKLKKQWEVLERIK